MNRDSCFCAIREERRGAGLTSPTPLELSKARSEIRQDHLDIFVLTLHLFYRVTEQVAS